MEKINFRTKKFAKIINIMLCILMITTSVTTMTISAKTETEIDNSLSYTFLFKEPSLGSIDVNGSEYTTIDMTGCMELGKQAGDPSLPVKFVKFLLPPMTTVASIEVSGEPIEIHYKDVDLTENSIYPYQNEVPLNDSFPDTLEINQTVYASPSLYPSNNHGDYHVGYSHGYVILDISLNPVQLIPKTGKLYYYPMMTVDINLQKSNEPNPFFANTPEDKQWVESLVDNPDVISQYDDLPTIDYLGGLCDPADHYDYVIITTTNNDLDHWERGGSLTYNWTDLINEHTINDGLNCTLVTVQDILACSDYYNATPLFNDTQTRIREFIKDAYQDWGTRYVLIAGDADTIPARQLYSSYEGGVDSDLYWSNLDNTFNADSDSIWGESGDSGFDLYSEIYIGRITCDTPQDVSNWLTKNLYYANSVDQSYLDSAAFYGGDSGWNTQGDDFIDYGAIKGTDNWLGPNPEDHGAYPDWLGFQYGFETWNQENPGMLYDLSVKWTAEPPNTGWSGGSESASVAGLKDAINDDQVTLLSVFAHADTQLSCDVSTSNWKTNYHNTKPFFITDVGCHSGDFNAVDDGVLDAMLFYSNTELAFACTYNTGYGWGSYADTNSSSCMQMKCFWDYFFDVTNNSISTSNWQFGKGQAWSKDAMAPTIDWTYEGAPESWRGVIECSLFFGDPALLLKASSLSSYPVDATNSSDTFNSYLRHAVRDSNNNLYCIYGNATNIFLSKSSDDGVIWNSKIIFADYDFNQYLGITIDSNDLIHVVFDAFVDDRLILFYSNTADGGDTWSTPAELINLSNIWIFKDVIILVDVNDALYVFVNAEDPHCSNDHIDLIKSTNHGTTWNSATEITFPGDGNDTKPCAAIDKNNVIYLIWKRTLDDDYLLFMKSSNAGVSWSSNTSIYHGSFNYSSFVVDSDTKLHVVFSTDAHELYYINSTAGGVSWSGTKNIGTCDEATISADSNDVVYVVYSYNWAVTCKYSSDGGISFSNGFNVVNNASGSELIWAMFPIAEGMRTNIPKTGFAMVYRNQTDDCPKYISFMLEWQINYIPTIGNILPENNSIEKCLVSCSITVNDKNGDNMNIYWYNNATGSWVKYGQNLGVSDGTYSKTASWATSARTKYYWEVTVEDGLHTVSEWYSFTTAAGTGTTGDPYQISNCFELNLTHKYLSAHYILINDIDMADDNVQSWNDGTGFIPIGDSSHYFVGCFDGQNYTISNLYEYYPQNEFCGLFGVTSGSGSVVENLILENVSIRGLDKIGGMVGWSSGRFTNCHVIGGSVTGWLVGGLVGCGGSVIVAHCHNTADIYGGSAGGIVGYYIGASITSSYNTGNISGGSCLGGIVGYAGNVGLYLSDCYNLGNVTGTEGIGGLIGYCPYSGSVTNCYSIGYVEGDSFVGGLIGKNEELTITNSYWNNETSGQETSDGGTSRTTAQMTYPYEGYDPPCTGLYQSWDLDNHAGGDSIWVHDADLSQNDGYPLFRWQYPYLIPQVVTGDATDIGTTTAMLHGNVNYNFTDYMITGFEYGLTDSYGDTALADNNPENLNLTGQYIYAGGLYSPADARLYTYWRSNLTNTSYSFVPYGMDIIRCIVQDNDYLYIGGDSFHISKYWKSNFTFIAQTPVSDLSQCMVADDECLYSAASGDNIINVIWKSNMTDKFITDCTNNTQSIAVDDTYVYAGQVDGRVVQYWKSNMTKKAESISFGTYARAMVLDDDYVYVAVNSPYKIYKLTKSNLSNVSESISCGSAIISLVSDGTYVYAGGTYDKVYQFWMSNLTEKAETDSYGADVQALVLDDTYLYVGGGSGLTPFKIKQYWLSNLTQKAESTDYPSPILVLSLEKYDNISMSKQITGLSPDTTYHYRAYAYNGEERKGYGEDEIFNTAPAPNSIPIIGTPIPNNHSTGQELSLTWRVSITDDDGDKFSYSIVCSNGQTKSASGASNGTKQLSISGLSYNTKYTVGVTVTDVHDASVYKWFDFTTKTEYVPPPPPPDHPVESPTDGDADYNEANGVLAITWVAGAYSTNSVLVMKNNSQPSSPTDGTVLQNSSSTSYNFVIYDDQAHFTVFAYSSTRHEWNHTGLDITYVLGMGDSPSGITTNSASAIGETSALLHGYLGNNGGGRCEYRFGYDVDSGTPYSHTTAWTGWILSGTAFSQTVSSLTKGELYYFKAQCMNFFDSSDASNELMFLTKPGAPTSFNVNFVNTTSSMATWVKGDGADRTIVLRKTGSYPSAVDDSSAILLYNDTGTSCSDSGLSEGSKYYYRAWSYCSEGGLHQFSDSYAGKYIPPDQAGGSGGGGGGNNQPITTTEEPIFAPAELDSSTVMVLVLFGIIGAVSVGLVVIASKWGKK